MNVTHDGKLLIAIGRSRKSAQWQNRELQWSELLDKLSQTTRTRETAAEYSASPVEASRSSVWQGRSAWS